MQRLVTDSGNPVKAIESHEDRMGDLLVMQGMRGVR